LKPAEFQRKNKVKKKKKKKKKAKEKKKGNLIYKKHNFYQSLSKK